MKEKDFIGMKVLKKGQRFSIMDCNANINNGLSDFTIKLDDGKSGYSVRITILKNILSFEDKDFQDKVVEFLKAEPPKIDYILMRAVELFHNNGIKKVISNIYGEISDELVCGKIYRRSAYDIYKACCKYWVFDFSQRGKFAPRKGLYAQNATPEDYGVWFIPHSNLTGDASSSWANIIEDDIIYEVWHVKDTVDDKCDRVTFVKQGNGEYVFNGIYRLEKIEKIDKYIDDIFITVKKTYKRISNTYPE